MKGDPIVPMPERFRPRAATIEAFSFSGYFPLAFLRNDETVRKAAPGSRSVIVSQGRHEVQINVFDYLVRDLASGDLHKESSFEWSRRWECVDDVAAEDVA